MCARVCVCVRAYASVGALCFVCEWDGKVEGIRVFAMLVLFLCCSWLAWLHILFILFFHFGFVAMFFFSMRIIQLGAFILEIHRQNILSKY